LAGESARGLEVADEVLLIAPEIILFEAYRAHALMFLDRTDEARALYLKYRDRKDIRNKQSWTEVVLGDFAELRKAGFPAPLMDAIEKELRG
jgi:hypothetical protein